MSGRYDLVHRERNPCVSWPVGLGIVDPDLPQMGILEDPRRPASFLSQHLVLVFVRLSREINCTQPAMAWSRSVLVAEGVSYEARLSTYPAPVLTGSISMAFVFRHFRFLESNHSRLSPCPYPYPAHRNLVFPSGPKESLSPRAAKWTCLINLELIDLT